jgi:hypothetical protein
MTGIRIVIGLIITAIVAVAMVPMFVLIDMAAGGDGLGICPDGIGSCGTSYFDGPELVAWLLALIFLLMMLLRAALHMQRLLDERRSKVDRDSTRRGNRPGD